MGSTASPARSIRRGLAGRRPAALQDELRAQRGERTEILRPESRFRDAADLWMGKIRERRADSTADTYASCLKNQVLPRSASYAWSSATSPSLDAFFSRLEQARKVVEQPDGTTVEKPALRGQHPPEGSRHRRRHHAAGRAPPGLAANPVRDLERIESPKGHRTAPPRGLTPEERRRLLAYVDTDKAAIRADLPDLIRFALGSGLRIGEICAVRWMDLDLDGIPVVSETDMRLVPVVAVRQNVYPVKGKGLVVHGGKTSTALRIVPLPQFVVTAAPRPPPRGRRPDLAGVRLRWPAGRPTAGPPFRPTSEPYARGRPLLDTPHTWRRTYATILDDDTPSPIGPRPISWVKPSFSKTYVSRGELHPDAAVYLDAALRRQEVHDCGVRRTE